MCRVDENKHSDSPPFLWSLTQIKGFLRQRQMESNVKA